jgi:FMN reductase [NAD(P)H]
MGYYKKQTGDDNMSEYSNETIKLLNERASLRAFSDRKISDEVMDEILGAVTHSASGGNLQPFSIIKITDKEIMEKIVSFGNQSFIKTAPVNLLFCIDFYRIKRITQIEKAPFTAQKAFPHFWIAFQDTMIAAQTACIAADSLGLGSVYIGTIFTIPESLEGSVEVLELPEGVLPVVLVSMGYPKIQPPIAKKYGISTLVHENKYRKPSDEEMKKAVEEKYSSKILKVKDDDTRIEKIRSVCEKVENKEFADEVVNKIEETGVISTFQYRFGLHYNADFMPSMNETFVEMIKKRGFEIFENPDFLK